MRKQNSVFQTAFLSEAGSQLENNDYFAYVELDKYACYVIADGLNEQPEAESARLAIETVLLAFQEHPSMRKSAVRSYLKAGNKALQQAKGESRLKASVAVAVTDYTKLRYGYAGNTRLRLYREGTVREKTRDMSLGDDMTKKRGLVKDALARHEERNNLYTWMGQGKGFAPYISKKIKLVNGDILTMYTRGIWENLDEGELEDIFSEAKDDPKECLDNVEDMLLSKQPEGLGNYTFAAVFADKIFLDPNKKRRIKKIIIVSVIVLVIALAIALVIWFLNWQRKNRIEEMGRRYEDTLDYIEDSNYVRAKEECEKALELAEKLRDKEKLQEISGYMKLIEAVNMADDIYAEGKYEEAQENYRTAKERSRYADHAADTYIDRKLESIADYLSVFDYIRLGDSLAVKGDFKDAEEKYLAAKNLATSIHYEEGRSQSMDALDRLYEDLAARQEETEAQVQERVAEETGAAELSAQGDKAFAEGDYEGAKVYYAMAMDKYQGLEDVANAEAANTKLKACIKKSNEKDEQKELAAEYVETAKQLEEEGELAEAKKQYILAKEVYTAIGEEEKVSQMENRMDMLELDREEKMKKEETGPEMAEDEMAAEEGQTVSGN